MLSTSYFNKITHMAMSSKGLPMIEAEMSTATTPEHQAMLERAKQMWHINQKWKKEGFPHTK